MEAKFKKWKKGIEACWRENRCLVRPFLVLLLIYLLGILAIILASVHYADDVARTGQGYAGWSGFSRYLSTILSHGLHADNYLTNIAPLPQILGVAMLAMAGIIVVTTVSSKEVFREKWTKWIWRVVAVVPLGLVPYMLECMSYQYDAVYMGMSVLFAVLPLVFYKRSGVWYVLMSVVGILVVCMTYQASIGIYPMLVVMLAAKEWNEKEKMGLILKKVGISVMVFILTVLIFQKFLMAPREVYVSNEIPGIAEFFPMFFRHLGHYFELLISDFKIIWLVLVVVIMVGFVVMFTVSSKRNKVVACFVGVGAMVLMAVMAYALYAALEKPLYTTRAMYAIGAWIAIMGVYIISGADKEKWMRVLKAAPAIAVVVLAWCFFVFGFTYGNMLAEQNDFRNGQVDMVISDLNELLVEMEGGPKKIQVKGQIGWAPAVASTPEKRYRILRRLLKPSFETNVPWMGYEITQGSGIPGLVYRVDTALDEGDLPKLKETVLYDIYGDEEGILVKFKGEDFGIVEED